MMLIFTTSCSTEESVVEPTVEPIDITPTESKKMVLNKIIRDGSLSNTYEYDVRLPLVVRHIH